MKRTILIFTFLIFISGCGLQFLQDDCTIARTTVGVSLPLALRKYEGSDKLQHYKEVIIAIDDILNFLKNKEQIEISNFNTHLEKLSGKLKPEEVYAIQAGINWILRIVRDNIPKETIGRGVLNLLICLFDEARKIFTLFSVQSSFVEKDKKAKVKGSVKPVLKINMHYLR